MRDLYIPHLPHTALAPFLFLEQFPFTGNVTAVALGRHILSYGLYRLTRYYLCPYRGLYCNIELLTGNELLQLLAHLI